MTKRPRVGLSPTSPQHGGRDADRPAPVVGVGERDDAGRHERRGAAGGGAGGVVGVPGVADGVRAAYSVVALNPNSGSRVLPRTLSPGRGSRVAKATSAWRGRGGERVGCRGRVGRPATSVLSLTKVGTPANGPGRRPRRPRPARGRSPGTCIAFSCRLDLVGPGERGLDEVAAAHLAVADQRSASAMASWSREGVVGEGVDRLMDPSCPLGYRRYLRGGPRCRPGTLASPGMSESPSADLVLEGGGVLGIAHVGAMTALLEAGYELSRVAGTSAGSIVGAMAAAGMPADRMRELASTMDYTAWRDGNLLDRVPLFGKSVSILRDGGVYEGRAVHEWVAERLEELGVRTFADLKFTDPDGVIPPERSYRLVVIVADITLGELVHLPWDYATRYGLDPDAQLVSDAVRASISIPFFFEPAQLQRADGRMSTLVDGGVLSNFPIDAFDRVDGGTGRWPTFGVKLLPAPARRRGAAPAGPRAARPRPRAVAQRPRHDDDRGT